MRKAIGIIPARNQSKRFPGKILATLGGVPLVVRVLNSAKESKLLSDVYIATDDEKIAAVVADYGGRVIMTGTHHKTGTDRVAEAVSKLDDCDIVINIQADEPFMTADIIDKIVTALDDPDIYMTTACSKIEHESDLNDPNIVKVVLDINGNALYFSRSRIPSGRYIGDGTAPVYGHLGIYGFKRDFLYKFASLERSSLELSESLEQLRAIENGYRIKTVVVDGYFSGINTREDLLKAEEMLERRDRHNG
ncbi:MAG: 3-deoxy-manno-octulosonate cytidylyltransferase [Candidatus Zixiibacteriota bacterium]|nr:MAG: 3-deoxy-manno-octulosonate cytidylyltransferase [candidate division Zixibacteria bacterium]